MCDPITIAALVTTAIGGVTALATPSAKPPPIPATAPDQAKKPNAVVKTGAVDGEDPNAVLPKTAPFVEKRTAGTALGKLGRSGLML